jgi:streptogramin lyase
MYKLKLEQRLLATTAPDGMIFDANGNLYFADLEQNAIMKMDTQEQLPNSLQEEKR